MVFETSAARPEDRDVKKEAFKANPRFRPAGDCEGTDICPQREIEYVVKRSPIRVM